MDKKELLNELSYKINSGEISQIEIQNMFSVNPKDESSSKKIFNLSITKVLYFLGIAIIAIGIIFYIVQIWEDIGSIGRITITLGLGLLFSTIGSVQLKKGMNELIGQGFHIIGGILIPSGALVTLNEISVPNPTLWPVTITFGAIFAYYVILDYVQKSPVLTFFAIANATAFIYLLTESILDGPYYNHDEILKLLTMIIGASYLFLANAFKKGRNKQLTDALNFIGSVGILLAGFLLVFDFPLWRLLYFIMVTGGIYLSIHLKSKSMLFVSTVFLFVHIAYITGKYFADSIGWPLSLIGLGFIFVGFAYTSIRINKKYINK